jgi:hypothetical protein
MITGGGAPFYWIAFVATGEQRRTSTGGIAAAGRIRALSSGQIGGVC